MNPILKTGLLTTLLLINTSNRENGILKQKEKNKEKTHIEITQTTETTQTNKTTHQTILLAGDIMLGTTYNNKTKEKYKKINELLENTIPKKDCFCGNLEGTLGTIETKKDTTKNWKTYRFKTPKEFDEILEELQIDFLNRANNHSFDYGTKGVIITNKNLDSLHISYAGLGTKPYVIKNINGTRYGFIGASPFRNTNPLRVKKIKEILKEIKDSTDITIVAFHAGGEGKEYLHTTRETEYFKGEYRGNPYVFAHKVIDAGADIVYGQGPHVPRGIELYNNKIIAYSLGNFITQGHFSLEGEQQYSPLIEVKVNSQGDFVSGNIYGFIQTKKGLKKDTTNKTIKLIKQLSEEDFPKSKLYISEEGKIKRKDE